MNTTTSNGMNFEKLKTLARRLGGILVMQGDEPEFVILSYDKYAPEQDVPMRRDDDLAIDQLNKEISALKEEIRQKETAEAELI